MFNSLKKILVIPVISALVACQAASANTLSLEKALPPLNNAPTAMDYHQVPIDFDSSESHEPLVDPSKVGIAVDCYYARDDGSNPPYFHKFASASKTVLVRQSIVRCLLDANKSLAGYGLEVLILDGYRPIKLQKDLWNHFIAQAKKTLKNPSKEECVKFADTFCSDPRKFKKDDWHTWPSHNTGGAVDVTLREIATGRELNMGGSFDDASEVSYTRYYEQSSKGAASCPKAQLNRRLLYNAMTAAGFANYPYEWWHFDYGTQMWVMNSHKQERAFYGRADAP